MIKFINPIDLGASLIGEEERSAVDRVMRSGSFFRYAVSRNDSENAKFETELGAWLGGAKICTVSSGTEGLRAALKAVGVGTNDIVLVSAYTFVATASAVRSLGAIPRPIDITLDLGMSLTELKAHIDRAKAVVPVYVPGHASNVANVVDIARHYKVPVIEDACQGLGVTTYGRFAGTIGDIGVYSFQQSKQLCGGEGGAVVSHSEELLHRVQRYTDHGADRLNSGAPHWPPDATDFGENGRLSEIQAAMLRPQLRKISIMIERQRHIYQMVRQTLFNCDVKIVHGVDESGGTGSSCLFLADDQTHAERLIAKALSHRLMLRWPWRHPFFILPPFRFVTAHLRASDCALVKNWSGRLLSVPIPPLENGQDIEQLISALSSVFKGIS